MRGAVAHVIEGTATERRVIVEFPSLTARRRGTAIAAALTGRWRFGLVLGGSLGALYRPWQDTSQLSPNTERIRSTPASRAL